MRKTTSTSSQLPSSYHQNHKINNNNGSRRYWYGSSPNLHNANTNLTPSSPILISGDITNKSPPYYYHSSVALDTPNSHYPPPTNSNTATTKTTTLKSNKMPGPRQQMSSSNNNFSGPSSNGGFGRRHTSTAATGDFDYSAPPNAMHQNHHHHNHHSAPSYNVEHLASFAVGSHFSVLSPADGVRKLKQMEQNSAICPVPMIFSLFPNRISVSELNGNLVEEFPMDLVSDPTAHTSSDPRDTFNNMLLFIVLEHVVSDGGTVPTELHIFQCINVPGGEVAEDLYNYIRGHYHKVGKRSPTKAMAASVYPNPLNEMPRGHFSHDSPSNGVEYFEMDVNTLNRCFDDIERFVARVQSVALAQRELEMQKNDGKQRKSKKAKEAAKAAQNGILHLRAQMPTQDEFVDIFQKFKLCFNLLAKLKNHIHEPSSPELIHFLFTPLTVLLDACHWGLGQQIAQQVCSPLLSYEACELLQVYLFPKETEVWHALGRAWNTPPEDWLGTLPPPYRPVFSDGWAPYGYSAQNIAQPPPTLTEPSVSSSIHPHQSDQNHHHQQQQHQQGQQRFGGAPAIHRGFSVPAQAGQSRFYYEPSRIRDDSVHRERRTAVDNIELERINLEKERLDLERRKVLDKERELLEQERRLREEAEKLEHERRQLHKESEKHSIAGSEPLPDLYRGHSSLQPSPSINRRSGSSVHLLHNGQSPPSFSAATSPHEQHQQQQNRSQQFSPIFTQSPRQKAFCAELGRRGCKIVQVTYDRAAQNSKELTVTRGEILEVLNDTKNWWECRNINSRSGYVPHTILTVLDESDEYDGPHKNEAFRSTTAGSSNHQFPSSGTSTPEVIRERRGRNGEFRYF
ncbi:hypothetical protein niasHS_000940 [Heterodera schachtii]|uniref:SH3 domain-containing protein n=1 Tax=Heterodera schachtii TaxID=97005 RepID=A0ABD2K7W3_HETSC